MALAEKCKLLVESTKRPRTSSFIGGPCRSARNLRQRVIIANVLRPLEPAQPSGNKLLQTCVELVFRIEPMWRLAKQMVNVQHSEACIFSGLLVLRLSSNPMIISQMCLPDTSPCSTSLGAEHMMYSISLIGFPLDLCRQGKRYLKEVHSLESVKWMKWRL